MGPAPDRAGARENVLSRALRDLGRLVKTQLSWIESEDVFEQNVAFTVAAMRKEEENRVVRWAVVRGFHERTAAPSSEPRRQSRVQVFHFLYYG